MTDTPSEDGQVRPFATILQDLRRGEVLDVAARELQDVVRAVGETGKKGKLVLTVEIAPMKGDSQALIVTAGVKATPPPAAPAEAVFFADRGHNLVRDDPRVQQIPGILREVKEAANGTIKEIR